MRFWFKHLPQKSGSESGSKEKFDVSFLWVLEKNTDAIRFYEAHGFHASGERKPEEGTAEYLIKMVLEK